jgi:hypothetical protein
MPLYAPRLPLIGTNGTVTANTPLLDLSQTWNNAGVAFDAVRVNVTQTAALGTSTLINLQIGGSSRFNIDTNGFIFGTGGVGVGGATAIGWSSRGQMLSPADGIIGLYNNARTDFTRLQFGGTTSAFPALKRAATVLEARLADDTAYTPIRAASYYYNSGSLIRDNADGVIQLGNNSNTDFTRLQFGGTTSSFPSLKRNGAAIEVRLADDSASATISAAAFMNDVAVTVASLPAAAARASQRRYVSDSTVTAAGNFGAIVAGGGANPTPVYSDGTNWRIG